MNSSEPSSHSSLIRGLLGRLEVGVTLLLFEDFRMDHGHGIIHNQNNVLRN